MTEEIRYVSLLSILEAKTKEELNELSLTRVWAAKWNRISGFSLLTIFFIWLKFLMSSK